VPMGAPFAAGQRFRKLIVNLKLELCTSLQAAGLRRREGAPVGLTGLALGRERGWLADAFWARKGAGANQSGRAFVVDWPPEAREGGASISGVTSNLGLFLSSRSLSLLSACFGRRPSGRKRPGFELWPPAKRGHRLARVCACACARARRPEWQRWKTHWSQLVTTFSLASNSSLNLQLKGDAIC